MLLVTVYGDLCIDQFYRVNNKCYISSSSSKFKITNQCKSEADTTIATVDTLIGNELTLVIKSKLNEIYYVNMFPNNNKCEIFIYQPQLVYTFPVKTRECSSNWSTLCEYTLYTSSTKSDAPHYINQEYIYGLFIIIMIMISYILTVVFLTKY